MSQVDAAAALSTAHLSDVSPYGVVMDPRIAAIWDGAFAMGPAFTVSTPPGDNASLHQAIDLINEGHVLVVNGRGFIDRALWGAIMSEAAQRQGASGLVVDGAVRDVAETRQLGFPVFAAGRTPSGPYNKVRGEIGSRIVCGGVTVNPGDWIHADDDGVVVIPRERIGETIPKATLRHELEERIIAGLRDGEALSSLLGILAKGQKSETK